jgi:hypothetical protein
MFIHEANKTIGFIKNLKTLRNYDIVNLADEKKN